MDEQLREQIRASGVKPSELARLADVGADQISRFLAGRRTLTLPVAGRICRVLGLILTKEGGGVAVAEDNEAD